MKIPKKGHCFRVLTLMLTFCFLLLSFPTMTTAGHPGSNDTPLDMERPIQPLYPLGLSVFNLYWDRNWDANNPGFLRADIDAATSALLGSTYQASLGQYGIPNITWGGSTTAALICGSPNPGDNVSSLGLIAFLQCEEAGGLFNNVPFAAPLPLPGVPYGSIIYNVIIPSRSVVDDGVSRSCTTTGGSYNAYHFFKDSPLPGLPLGLPPPPRRILYTVIPVACVTSVAEVMGMISHEVVEAATDPLPLLSWADSSTVTDIPGILGVLRTGEVSDICMGTGFQSVPVTLGGISMRVASYWSNDTNACMVGTSRVVDAIFDRTGLPPQSLGGVFVNNVEHTLPYREAVLEGATYTYTRFVSDNAGNSFESSGLCSGTVVFPAGNTTANASVPINCVYRSSPPVNLPGGHCFIATAAYGSYLAPEVQTLRRFRDDYLLTNQIGQVFVRFYYRTSPYIADYIRAHQGLRMITRWTLTPIIYGVKYPQSSLLILLGAFIFPIAYRLRKE